MRPPIAALPKLVFILTAVFLGWLEFLAPSAGLLAQQSEPQTITIPDGTLITLYLMDDLSSKTNRPDDPVHFKVREDVRINGKVVIAWNAPGVGKVAIVGGRGLAGKAGSVNFTVDYVQAVDGSKIRVRGAPTVRGGSNTAVAAAAAVAYGPAALLVMRGAHAEIRKGTMLSVYADGPGKVTLSGPASPLKAATSAARGEAAARQPSGPLTAAAKPEPPLPEAATTAPAEKPSGASAGRGPELHIMEPPVRNPSEPVEVVDSPLNLQGAALDPKGVSSVTVNGQEAEIRSSGDSGDRRAVMFTARNLTLQEGLNRVRIEATNREGGRSRLAISLWMRGKPKPLARRALSQVQIIELLKGGVPNGRVAALVKERGIDFQPTGEFLEAMRAAGGDQALEDSLKSAKQAKQ